MHGARRSALLAAVVSAALLAPLAAAAPSTAAPTADVSAQTVSFGSSIVLKGTVPGAAAGEEVRVLSQACGFTGPVPIGRTTTSAGGAYSFRLEPMLNSILSVQVGDAQSNSARVTVKPQLQLRRLSARTFALDVSVGNGGFFTQAAVLQRLDTRTKRWTKVATARLKATSDPGALVAVSSGTFHAAVKPGTALRAIVSQATVGECYRPATSAPLKA